MHGVHTGMHYCVRLYSNRHLLQVNNTKKTNQVEVRLAKKAFENLAIPEFGRNLLPVEVSSAYALRLYLSSFPFAVG